MELTLPFWFRQRQGKAEEAGSNLYRLTAPNLKEAFIHIERGDNGLWQAGLTSSAGGPDQSTTGAEFSRPEAAWEAAFELYRTAVVI
jgi:hypothetical protein